MNIIKRILLIVGALALTVAPVSAQAPTLPTTGYLQGYSGLTANVTISSGFTAGNTVIVGIMQFGSALRTATISDGTNSYSHVVTNPGPAYTFAQIYAKVNVSAVAASSTLTVTFDNNQDGYVFVQEISPSTLAGITGTADDLVGAGTTYLSASPGVTTPAGDVLLFAVGGLSGGSPNRIPIGAGWVSLIDGSSNDVAFFMYQRSSAAITTGDTGPWAGDNARAYSGVIAAFYASGGGGGPAATTPLKMLLGIGGTK